MEKKTRKAPKRYATLSVSSGIRKNYRLEHKREECKSVKIRSVSDTTSELEIIFPTGEKLRFPNLDSAEIAIRNHFGVKVSVDKNSGKPKGLGYQNLGRFKGEKFISLYEAFQNDIPFEEYLAKAE